jgi:hypothetical protein
VKESNGQDETARLTPYEAGTRALACYLEEPALAAWNAAAHTVHKLYLMPAVFGEATVWHQAMQFTRDHERGKVARKVAKRERGGLPQKGE